MRTLKRVIAWILVVLSVLGIVAMLAGLVGSWIIRNRVTDVTLDLLTVGETAVTATSNGLNRIDDRLDKSQANIASLEGDIVSAGENLAETSLVGTVIGRNISEETAASISEARATAVTMAETVAAIDEAIQTANEIPFVTLDGMAATLINDLANDLDQLHASMTEFREGVQQRREERASNAVDFFTGLTAEMSQRIGGVQTKLDEMDGRLNQTSANLAEAKETLPRTFTLITLAVNIILLLVALAFASLLLHSWALAQNPDLTLKDLTAVKTSSLDY